MADTPADGVERWGANEVITASKMNKMVDAILYAVDTSDSAKKNSDTTSEEIKINLDDWNARVGSLDNDVSELRQQTDTANNNANNAQTLASRADSTAQDALKKINAATGGKGYASLTDINTFAGANTFNSNVTFNGSTVISSLLQLNGGFRSLSDGNVNGNLTVTKWIDGKLKTKASDTSTTITQYANAIDTYDGIWRINNSNLGTLPMGIIDGFLIIKSDGTNTNSGLMIISNKGEYDKLYINYVTNGNMSAWQSIGSSKLETIIKRFSTLDINTITTTGMYDIEVTTLRNGPAGVTNATLLVMQGSENNNPSSRYLTQILVTQNTGVLYTRSCWNGSWTEWGQAITENYLKLHNITGDTKPDVKGPSTSEIKDAQDLNQLRKDGRYILMNNNNTNLPNDPDTNSVAVGPFTCNVIANSGMTIVSQELVQTTKGYKYVRSFANNSWTNWSVLTPYS